MNSSFDVYKVIDNNSGGASTVEPSGNKSTSVFTTGDSYRWKYMYTITTADSEKFLTKSFMPVKTLAMSPALSSTDVNKPQQDSQILSRDLATAAGIERIVIENGGSGSSVAAPIAHNALNFAYKNNV